MLRKDSGTITILGRDNQDNIGLTKEDVGVVLDEVGIPECLNTRQLGSIMARTFRNWDSAEYSRLLQKLQLPEDKSFREFSRGMKMKLGIAVAMSHGAKLLILDEATSGLDPVVRDEVAEMFCDFTREENHSILISSHIHKGKLMLFEEKDQLLAEYGLVHCDAEQFSRIPSEAIRYRKQTPYGIEAMVRREGVPGDIHVSPISIEELFVLMVKEAN